MGALPIQIEAKRSLPDYLPARMVNEYAYCPRLFFYEWVEGLFAESVDTVEGAIQHKRVDARATGLPSAGEIEGTLAGGSACPTTSEGKTTDDATRSSVPQSIHSRSVTLSSERLRVIAKMDLVEVEDGVATPVDYKHGRPRDGADGLELWPADRAQLGVQGIGPRGGGDCGRRPGRGAAPRESSWEGPGTGGRGGSLTPARGGRGWGWCSTGRRSR